jgi:hypothetical protein
VVNVSGAGIFTVRPTEQRLGDISRVQLEIPLPEASESVWALGEVVFERPGRSCVGSGIRFLSMAHRDHRLIRDLVEERRQKVLARILEHLKRRRKLTELRSPFAVQQAALAERYEESIKRYLITR